MISPNTQQVFLLSDSFHQMALTIGEYISKNKSDLDDEDRNNLYDNQVSLLQQAADINMLGTALVFDDVQQSLTQLNSITSAVKKSMKKIMAVQNAINIAASLVELATAILNKNPKEIGSKTVAAFRSVGIGK